jgi:Ran GTPase-activating protein (RanGAP) involved in mRNA processing and transport
VSSNLTASAKTIMQKENTNEPKDEEEKSDEQIIEEIVEMTSDLYDLDYAK